MRLMATIVSFLLIGVFTSIGQAPQSPNLKDGVNQCGETIRQRIVPIQSQYANELEALIKTFQAQGDLENLVAVKKELDRSKAALRIEDNNIVQTPVALRDIQLKYKLRQERICQQTAKEFMTMLEGRKKKLTVDGKIDEALAVKQDIETIGQRYGVLGASKEAPPSGQPLYTTRVPTPSNTPVRRLIVEAFIDGKSVLKVQGGKLWWEHQTAFPPGKWDGRNEPTIINGQKWVPEWDGNKSKPLEGSTPFVSPLARELRIHKIKARGAVTISEKPTSTNQNAVAVLFDDFQGGADWYKIEIYW